MFLRKTKRNMHLPSASSSRTRALNLINWATWTPKENGLMALRLTGSIVDPPVAKLHPVRKFGAPKESKYGFMNGKSIASTVTQFKCDNSFTVNNKESIYSYTLNNTIIYSGNRWWGGHHRTVGPALRRICIQ